VDDLRQPVLVKRHRRPRLFLACQVDEEVLIVRRNVKLRPNDARKVSELHGKDLVKEKRTLRAIIAERCD
jgi:hypothetical protein